jgi:hypothetical protein
MTNEEIIEMARQAGFVDYELDDGTTNAFDKRYETFAKLVAEHEREACVDLLMGLHASQSVIHNYYHFASNAIKKVRGQE